MARVVDLWKYLPPFLKQFKEMVELIATENPEFELFAHNTDALLNEMFIQTATETGLARFEKVLGISPISGSSLDTRRSAVMTRWHDTIPYTIRALRERIVAIQGNEDVEIHLHRENPYVIEITTCLEKQGQVDDLEYILSFMIPANLVIISNNVMKRTIAGQIFTGSTVVENSSFTITSQTNKNHSVNANAYSLGVVSTSIERTIN